MKPFSSRLQVVDALRGFAIVSIMLLHNIEHFDFYFTPANLPAWMPAIDNAIWDTLFFLFGGKSYAIFALLFGLTFFIQDDNQTRKGKDFRGRFAWRLLLLLGFGTINSAFYQGDILTIYAILGFVLIPVARLSDKAVFWVATVLMVQPYMWVTFIHAVQNPEMVVANPVSWSYFGRMGDYVTGSSLGALLWGNLTNGKLAVFHWTWESGRVFQTSALFMFGMLAGRRGLFVPGENQKRFWIRAFMVAVVAFTVLFYLKTNLKGWIDIKAIRRPLVEIVTTWANMGFMMVLVSGFVLLFQSAIGHRMLRVFSPIGRMSLSNYMIQSIIGSFVYYGFGLGLYEYTGSTYCLAIGLVLAVLQGIFSTWWMSRHKYGPLEGWWHKATWI